MKPSRVGSLLLVCLWVMGCGAAPRAWSAEPGAGTGLLIEPAAADALGYVPNWASALGVPRGQQLTSVVLLEDLIVAVEEPGNTVSAVDVRTGELKWRQVVGDPDKPIFTPVRREDRVYINTSVRFFAIDADTGKVEQIVPLEQVVDTGPVLVLDFAIFGSINGRVFAHDVKSNFAKWSYDLTSRITAPPIEVGFNVFVADAAGVYVMLGGDNGTPLWRGHTFGPITAAAAVDRLSVFVPSHDQSLYALARPNGRDRWVYRATVPLTEAPEAFGLTVYLPLPGIGLAAVDAVEGTERWRLEGPGDPVTVRDERDLILADESSLRIVDVETGNVRVQRPTQRLAHVLAGPDNSLILVSPQGRLLRLNPKR